MEKMEISDLELHATIRDLGDTISEQQSAIRDRNLQIKNLEASVRGQQRLIDSFTHSDQHALDLANQKLYKRIRELESVVLSLQLRLGESDERIKTANSEHASELRSLRSKLAYAQRKVAPKIVSGKAQKPIVHARIQPISSEAREFPVHLM